MPRAQQKLKLFKSDLRKLEGAKDIASDVETFLASADQFAELHEAAQNARAGLGLILAHGDTFDLSSANAAAPST